MQQGSLGYLAAADPLMVGKVLDGEEDVSRAQATICPGLASPGDSVSSWQEVANSGHGSGTLIRPS